MAGACSPSASVSRDEDFETVLSCHLLSFCPKMSPICTTRHFFVHKFATSHKFSTPQENCWRTSVRMSSPDCPVIKKSRVSLGWISWTQMSCSGTPLRNHANIVARSLIVSSDDRDTRFCRSIEIFASQKQLVLRRDMKSGIQRPFARLNGLNQACFARRESRQRMRRLFIFAARSGPVPHAVHFVNCRDESHL